MMRGATNATSPDEGARPRLQGGLVCRRARRRATNSGGQRAGQTRRVAGLRPASESVVPYIIGHVLPVPSETGKSYGDLDDDYVTASYRVFMTEAEAKRVFAYVRHLQATRPLWNGAIYNCVAFIQDIAREMGLKVPGNHWMYPEDWVNRLKELNGGRRYMSSPAVAQASSKPSASAQKPAAPARQTAAVSY